MNSMKCLICDNPGITTYEIMKAMQYGLKVCKEHERRIPKRL